MADKIYFNINLIRFSLTNANNNNFKNKVCCEKCLHF